MPFDQSFFSVHGVIRRADDLKKLYRITATDERNTAVLKPTAK